MKWVYNDGGRKAAGYTGAAGDCVTRAIAIATERPYKEVYDALAEGIREFAKGRSRQAKHAARGGATPRNGVHRPVYQKYLESLGWTWVPTMQVGKGCQVHLHDGELPGGRLIVAVSKHLTAVVDGVIYDTHDPQRDFQTFVPDTGQALRPNQGRNVNGVFTRSRRCVYGYYHKSEAPAPRSEAAPATAHTVPVVPVTEPLTEPLAPVDSVPAARTHWEWGGRLVDGVYNQVRAKFAKVTCGTRVVRVVVQGAGDTEAARLVRRAVAGLNRKTKARKTRKKRRAAAV